MQPIVNGLEEEYSDSVAFRYLNANTDGVAAFDQLGLRGHPAFVIFSSDGQEVSRLVGLQDETSLRNLLDSINK